MIDMTSPSTFLVDVDSSGQLVLNTGNGHPLTLRQALSPEKAALLEAVCRGALLTLDTMSADISDRYAGNGGSDVTSLSLSATPVFGPDGSCARLRCDLNPSPPRPPSTPNRVTDERFRLLAASSPIGIFQADISGRLVYVNPRWLEITGLTYEQAEGRPWEAVIHAGDEERVLRAARRTMDSRDEFFMRYRLVRPDGEVRWVHVRAAPLYTDDGTFYGYVGSLADVTSQVSAEAERNRLTAILEATTDLVAITDARGWPSYMNKSGRRMLGIGPHSPVDNLHSYRFATPASVQRIRDELTPALEQDGIWSGELELLRLDGGTIPVSQVTIAHSDSSGRIEYVSTVCRDISERTRMQDELERRALQQATVASLGQQALGGAEVDYLVEEVVAAIDETLEMSGTCVLEPFGESDGSLVIRAGGGHYSPLVGRPLESPELRLQALKTLESGRPEVRRLSIEGTPSPAYAASVLIGDPERPFGILCGHAPRKFSTDDIHFLQSVGHVLATAIGRKRTDEEILHRALHDALTSLPNRTLLLDRLEWALARSRRSEGNVAVFFLDLDNFKMINDGLGHSIGDQLLVSVAHRLTQVLRPGDTVARFGGDEFVVLCEEVVDDDGARQIAERISAAIGDPYLIEGREVFATTSIGISLAHGDVTPETVLADADAAMYRAKALGRARFELFDETLRRQSMSRLETQNALRRALQRDELRIHYQPEVRLAGRGDGEEGAVVALEALIRWDSPERGLVLPGEFVPEAEETGLIVPLGQWVLRHACIQVAEWRKTIPQARDLAVAVNLSARQFSDPDLTSTLAEALAHSGLEPEALCLEITESVIMDDVDTTATTLRSLRETGARVVIDDFGTGYSSLSYLRRFPVDLVKIDQSFVDGLGKETEDSAIVTAIVSMSHALGLGVVAEGVETDEQLAELRKLGCDYAQGYLISIPLDASEVELRLREPGRGW
ncbi:MAG: EAL domain-containing protein [Actinobacteria bacterium ATB1]|nr:EAL domain-containing protein [Actinobacteria bacterium ATB1]